MNRYRIVRIGIADPYFEVEQHHAGQWLPVFRGCFAWFNGTKKFSSEASARAFIQKKLGNDTSTQRFTVEQIVG